MTAGQISKPKIKPAVEKTPADLPHKDTTKLKAEMDALLDEIDEVLEANAEEFVKGYIQKGGE